MLDTGSDGNFLSLRYARYLAACPPEVGVHEFVLHGFFGIGQTAEPIKALGFERPIRVSLGGESPSLRLRSEDLVAGVSVLDTQISPTYDFEVPLLLGAAYLDRFRRFTIDFPRHELRFEPAPPPASTSPSMPKEQTTANPLLDPTRVPHSSIEQGYCWIWWSDQWVQVPQGIKLGPVAPAITVQPPPFPVPVGYVALRYKPQEARARWMLVLQVSQTTPSGEVIVR